MAKRKKTGTADTSTDPVTTYARAVNSGKIVAGPHVRNACARHLRDLKDGPKRGLFWDVDKANRAIGYFRDVLFVDIVAGDTTEGEMKPFELIDWQAFIVGSLFGWMGPDGFRRFRMAFVETGKGSGKSPLAAGIGNYMLTADGEFRAEVYAAAQKKDQAKVLFRDAVAMVEKSPALSERLHMSGGVEKTNIAYLEKGSFFRPISTEERGKGQSGPRPHCGLLDEIHEHSTNAMVEFMRAGTKGRNQALIFMITNSGSDRTSVCYDYHEYGAKVCEGSIEDDSMFAYICALDEGDDPFKDESCWAKANPSLGVTITEKYLREQVVQARGMPSKQNLVLRLNFCVWTDAVSVWINKESWDACQTDEPDLSELLGLPCWCGLDLSFTTDLSALATVFKRGEGFEAFVDFWKPEAGLKEAAEQDRVPYHTWVSDGFLRVTPGRVIKLPAIADRIVEIASLYDLQWLAYDKYRHKELDSDLVDLGIEVPMVEHPQGFRRAGVLRDADGNPVLGDDGKPKDNPLWMPDSVQEIENAVIEEQISIHRNPVLTWNAASAVIRQDPAGTDNRVLDKRKSTGRIDGVVALAMAIGAAKRMPGHTVPAPFVMWS